MHSWQLQDAKARLSEVLKQVAKQGPQEITLHGKAVAVLISKTQYDQLMRPKLSFVEFMRNSPLVGVKLSIARNKSSTRDIDL